MSKHCVPKFLKNQNVWGYACTHAPMSTVLDETLPVTCSLRKRNAKTLIVRKHSLGIVNICLPTAVRVSVVQTTNTSYILWP